MREAISGSNTSSWRIDFVFFNLVYIKKKWLVCWYLFRKVRNFRLTNHELNYFLCYVIVVVVDDDVVVFVVVTVFLLFVIIILRVFGYFC